MPPGGNGVSVGVGVNAGPALRQLGNLSTGLGKLAGSAKNLFGGNSAQQVTNYNKHLTQLERNLERINTRVKTLVGTQQQLLQQQRQLQQTGTVSQQQTAQRALQQNRRSLSFWQAKQMGGETALSYAQQNRPGVGGGGGGTAAFFTGQMTNLAGGLGGPVLKALGIGAVAKGMAEVVAKAFTTALDEQKLLADIYPKMGHDMATSSPKGYMNMLRDKSMPLGYSGIEALQIEGAMAPGSSHGGLGADSLAAMKMGRAFGIDAGGQASMLAEGGKMGGFVPGQAKRFAEMLAREISVTGLGPRAQEVQEATLMLMHRQLAASGSTSASAAMTQQIMMAKTGVPGLQGQFGADVIAGANATMGGATDDASIAFQEATLRDQRGVKGYYNLRRWKENLANDPTAIRDTIREAYKLSANDDAAKDLISRQTGMPMTLLDKMGAGVRGGLRNIGSDNIATQMALKNSGGLDKKADDAMKMPGNQWRKGEATISGLMARGGTPMVQSMGKLVDFASSQVQSLLHLVDTGKSDNKYLGSINDHIKEIANNANPKYLKQQAQATADFRKKYGIDPSAAHYDLNGKPVTALGLPLPAAGSKGPTAAQIQSLRRRLGPPVLPGVGGLAPAPIDGKHLGIQRGDAGHLHLHVSFDHSGAIHHHAKLAFMGMVKDSLTEIQQQTTRGHLHTRYPRA